MRVFVTGASGFIGSAIVRELVASGHDVVGLARSDEAAAAVAAAGAEVHRGALGDLESLHRGAAASDGVIHTAFIHDFSNYPAAAQADQLAIETLGSELEGSECPLVVTAGTFGVRTENDDPSTNFPRVSEKSALAFASRGVRASVMRLPASVHGEGDHGFVPRLIAIAREKRVSAYIGDGNNRWPAVHRLDAARLYTRALESAPAGTKLHGVADEGVRIRDIAEIIGRRLNVPVVSKTRDEASDHFGFLAMFLGEDVPASSVITQERFGWHPEQLGLLADLDHDYYFKTPVTP